MAQFESSLNWDFRDGSTSIETAPVHEFAKGETMKCI
jgi:PKD repeat protein